MTIADPVPRPARVTAVDVARGAALPGMMAMHTLDAFDDEDAPTTATLVAAGRVDGDVSSSSPASAWRSKQLQRLS